MTRIKELAPGALIALIIGVVSVMIHDLEPFGLSISSMLIAIILGLIMHQILPKTPKLSKGFQYCGNQLLKFTIVLMGFRLSLTDIQSVGIGGLITILIVCPLTFALTYFLGKKLKMTHSMSAVIASGFSICGASAIAAASPLVKAKEEDVTCGIAMITVLGTISMIAYPALYYLLTLTPEMYALWNGVTVAEVAQVLGAGVSVSASVGAQSSVVKLTRVLLLVPLTFALSMLTSKHEADGTEVKEKVSILKKIKKGIPNFVIFFFGIVVINSFGIIPPVVNTTILDINNILIACAMAGLGLRTSFAQLKNVGIKPFALSIFSWIFITVVGFAVSFFMV